MTWNWQQPDWPHFSYDSKALEPLEARFWRSSGEFIGAYRHVGGADRDALRIELISAEALTTSAIEGEMLDRDSVQSSLRAQFGLADPAPARVSPAEAGIAEMMADLYKAFARKLTHKTLSAWHTMLLSGNRRIKFIGNYRRHDDPMQIVSGALPKQKIHFEAPPSRQMKPEMDAFIDWFNDSAPGRATALPSLARAGIAHLYFVSIHPFEDGNGRIARVLSEKSLAQNLGQPSLIALAYTIERARKAYYAALERNNKDNEITDWLVYFANTVLEAQHNTMKRVDFYLAKAKFYDRLEGQLNERQQKAIARMFREGIDGFKGGLSAENYITITGASRATTTRDLQELVAKGALTKTGELRYTRYYLNLNEV